MQASESAIFCGDCFGHLRITRGLDVKTNDGNSIYQTKTPVCFVFWSVKSQLSFII